MNPYRHAAASITASEKCNRPGGATVASPGRISVRAVDL